MELMFLGAGSAFCLTPGCYQSNMVLTSPSGRRLLIDCGSDIRFSLAAAGLAPRDISDIYISHLHADHVGGLEYMGFTSRFASRPFSMSLIANEAVMRDLWTHSLYGGMSMTDGDDCSLAYFFTPRPVDSSGLFRWEGLEIELVPTRHVTGKHDIMFSYGLFFRAGSTRVFLTTDTVFAPKDLAPFMEQADVVFHDCETIAQATGVHAHYRELVGLPAGIKAKTWLYHYNDGDRPDPCTEGFRGFVKTRDTFSL